MNCNVYKPFFLVWELHWATGPATPEPRHRLFWLFRLFGRVHGDRGNEKGVNPDPSPSIDGERESLS